MKMKTILTIEISMCYREDENEYAATAHIKSADCSGHYTETGKTEKKALLNVVKNLKKHIMNDHL
jgi:hypothetical protein